MLKDLVELLEIGVELRVLLRARKEHRGGGEAAPAGLRVPPAVGEGRAESAGGVEGVERHPHADRMPRRFV